MEIIKVKNTSYARYEEVLLYRDNLRKEAEQYHMAYIREFGDLITKAFELKIECIRKKKMIAYCQRQINMGKKVNGASLDIFIEQEMASYREQLEQMISDVKAVKSSKRVPQREMNKIKETFRKLAKAIHPDMHPELAGDEKVKDYWQRIMIAYTFNQLEDMEQLELLVKAYLDEKGIQDFDVDIENLDEKISKVEEEIEDIIKTKPYTYKELLNDEEERLRRKQEYEDEIATYEMYSAQLDGVLAEFEIEERKLS